MNAQQAVAIEPTLLAERNSLINRLHSNSQQRVHRELHNRSGAAGPHIKMFSRDHAEYRLGSGETPIVPASKQDQRSLLGRRSAPRYGYVEHINSTLGS